jgi:uncharacterized protein (TIGR03437 family)
MKPASFISILIIFVIAVMAAFVERGNARSQGRQRKTSNNELATLQRTSAFAANRRQVEEKLTDARYLLTRAAIFDPLTQEPEAARIGGERLEMTNLQAAFERLKKAAAILKVNNQEADANGYFIVQYRNRIHQAWTDDLRARGCEITGYLPNNAFVIRASAEIAGSLHASGAVRWVGAYGAGLKVAQELLQLADEATGVRSTGFSRNSSNVTIPPEGGMTNETSISILSFKGASAVALRDAINRLPLAGAPVIEERGDERVWAVLAIRREDLSKSVAALANLEGIEWIEQRRPHLPQNDNGVRVVQTGFVGADTPLYRNGLTGAGQIYGTADTGLDADHSQFRLDNNSASQTLSYATTTATLASGLLPFKITNQSNKVLTYYLVGSSSFKELKDNPNGGQTLDPERNSGSRYLNAVAYDDSAQNYHGTLTTSVAVGRNYGANGSGAVPGIPTRSKGDGVAPDARIVFQDVGHPSGQLPGVDSVSQALIHQQAYSSGVRVHNNSYGPAPPAVYDQDAADVDEMMWRLRDYTIFYAAGNHSVGDYQVINAAKNNIVVGATDSPSDGRGSVENLGSYSNHGPTFDGRIKPDIVAPGTVIAATEDRDSAKSSSYNNSTSATAKDAAVNPTDPNNEGDLLETAVSGTSYASAMAAGGALLVRQYFTDGFYQISGAGGGGAKSAGNAFTPSNALVKAIILNSGRNLTGRFTASNYPISTSGALPNNGQGWGRVALDDALYFAGDRRELRVLADIYNGATGAEANRPAPNPAITTGQTHTYQITSVSNVEPLRITLAWSDPRAAVGSIVALVNDLNLEVTDPEGKIYRGNVNFTNAWSQPANGPTGLEAFDNRNPVEAVYIQNPIPGAYTVRVIGANVPGNGQMQITAQPGDQTIDSNKQGYALIATGNFTAGAQPVLNLAASTINGGVNADPFISKNETVTAAVSIRNPSSLNAQNVSVTIEVDAASQVPASAIRINSSPPGQSAAVNIGDIVAGATKDAAFQIMLLDDGQDRVGQTVSFKVAMTPANGLPFVTQFSTLAQLKLVTYRTRFEPTPDPGGANIIVIPEADWRKRTDHDSRADEKNFFDGDWLLTTAQHDTANGSTASLTDPSGVARSYGFSETSRSDGQVYDDSRWWTPKLALPGLRVTESTGLAANPEDVATIKGEIDSFDVDVKTDFAGDVKQSASSGDFFILRARTYNNTVSIRSTDDSGATSGGSTNLLYLDSQNSSGNGFGHYSGNNFASGDGVFNVDDDDDDNSDVFFRFELQFRRNGYPQSGDGVFVDNLVVRLRVADTAVYASPTAGTQVTVNAASYDRAVAPGEIVAAFGAGFPAGVRISAVAASLPLPTELANVAVRINGIAAPLFFVGAGGSLGESAFQINYQLPFETAPGTAYVEVLSEGGLVASEYLVVSGTAPGIFTINSSGQGQAVALNQDFSPNGSAGSGPGAKPEARGRFIIVYANGQGRQLIDSVTSQLLMLPSGTPAPTGGPLYLTAGSPTVTIGGATAQVAFSGLAPGFVGLWQLNIRIPDNAPTGNAVPLIMLFGDKISRTTTVAVN